MEKLSADYWNNRYKESTDFWDLKEISPPFKAYIDQLLDKNLRILIPGCGYGYEGKYLFDKGFKNVFLLDFAEEPLLNFRKENPEFPVENLIKDDFFTHTGKYDLILEQTLFCAIDPKLRRDYSKKTSELLDLKGKLVGLLFNREFDLEPPYGGNKEEYLTYFTPFFSTVEMENCYNSILPRMGSELFVKMVK